MQDLDKSQCWKKIFFFKNLLTNLSQFIFVMNYKNGNFVSAISDEWQLNEKI
jgi:hypothetical protein